MSDVPLAARPGKAQDGKAERNMIPSDGTTANRTHAWCAERIQALELQVSEQEEELSIRARTIEAMELQVRELQEKYGHMEKQWGEEYSHHMSLMAERTELLRQNEALLKVAKDTQKCADAVEEENDRLRDSLSDANRQNSDMKTVLRGLVEQIVADARSTGPFKITSSQALKEAMTFAWRALEIHEKGSTPQTGIAPHCNACGAVVYVRVKELDDANRLLREAQEELKRWHSSYGHGSDAPCGLCAERSVHEHTWARNMDQSGPWQYCTGCPETRNYTEKPKQVVLPDGSCPCRLVDGVLHPCNVHAIKRKDESLCHCCGAVMPPMGEKHFCPEIDRF